MSKEPTQYMNIHTGSVDIYAGWFYAGPDGQTVNAVNLGEVIAVERDERGDWREKQ